MSFGDARLFRVCTRCGGRRPDMGRAALHGGRDSWAAGDDGGGLRAWVSRWVGWAAMRVVMGSAELAAATDLSFYNGSAKPPGRQGIPREGT